MKNIITILLLFIGLNLTGQVVDRFHIYPTATFLPANYDGAKTYDLVIYLHGLGEAGGGTSNLAKIYTQGLPKVLKDGFKPPKDVIVCAPQDNWGGIDSRNIPAIIDAIKAKYKVGNIYLTGISAGGQGVGGGLFGISETFLKTIAGAVVISPGWIDTKNAAWAKNSATKYWFMAGTQSADVSGGYTANATNIHNAINAQAPGKSKLTVKAGIGHGGSFTTPYQDTAFWNFIGGTVTAPPPVVIPPVVTTPAGLNYAQIVRIADSTITARATPVVDPLFIDVDKKLYFDLTRIKALEAENINLKYEQNLLKTRVEELLRLLIEGFENLKKLQ